MTKKHAVLIGQEIVDVPVESVGATVEQYNAAMAAYWRKNPDATAADVKRFQNSWGPLTRTAATATAAKSCGADGSFESWVFFLLCLAALLLVVVIVPPVYNRVRRSLISRAKREGFSVESSDMVLSK